MALPSSNSAGLAHESVLGNLCESGKRVAFVTVPLSGHMRVAVALAAETFERGYEVDFIVGMSGISKELREMESRGPAFSLFGLIKGADTTERISWASVASSTGRLGGSRVKLFEEIARVAEDQEDFNERLLEIVAILAARRPDVVVLDHSQMVVREWAQKQGIPTIVMHTPYYATGSPTGCAAMSGEWEARLAEVIRERNPMGKILKGRRALGLHMAQEENAHIPEGAKSAPMAHGLEPHTLVFCEPELLNDARVPPRVHAVGPCLVEDRRTADENLLPWLQDAVACNEGVLYVALGTLANGFLTASAVHSLLDAFSGLGAGWRVLWSLPKAQQHLLKESGRTYDMPWLRVENFVRQRAVLAHPAVGVFLSHGGQSSVNEALSAGVPVVCMPLFCDQYEVAEAVRKHGLGLVYHKDELLDHDTKRLTATILRASSTPMFRSMTHRYARLMQLRSGCARAVEVIESVMHAGADFQELWQGLPEGEAEQISVDESTRRGGA